MLSNSHNYKFDWFHHNSSMATIAKHLFSQERNSDTKQSVEGPGQPRGIDKPEFAIQQKQLNTQTLKKIF